MQLGQEQKRLPCRDNCRQHITIRGGKSFGHGTSVGRARTNAEIESQSQIGSLLKLLLLGAQRSQQISFLHSRQVRLLDLDD